MENEEWGTSNRNEKVAFQTTEKRWALKRTQTRWLPTSRPNLARASNTICRAVVALVTETETCVGHQEWEWKVRV